MSGLFLDEASCEALKGVDPRLCAVAWLAHQHYAERWPRFCFRITSGVRTLDEQRRLYEAKKSRVLQSHHLTGRAFDVAILSRDRTRAYWDFPMYSRLNQSVQHVAQVLGVDVTWGGEWTTFRDGVHFELD